MAVALLVLVPTAALGPVQRDHRPDLRDGQGSRRRRDAGRGHRGQERRHRLRAARVTDTSGFYRLDLLPSGTYDVRADLAGFKSRDQAGRGRDPRLFGAGELRSGRWPAVEEEIVVTAESPVVETTNPSITSSVSDAGRSPTCRWTGRDFTDFVLLTPGATYSDAEPGAGGRGGLNIGARGIQNSFNIDGSNSQSSFFGEERGGTRPPFTFSQAAIKEFQVLRSSYNLQFQATGGVINAITKSGTNEFHGEVFGYYTDDSLSEDYALLEPGDERRRPSSSSTVSPSADRSSATSCTSSPRSTPRTTRPRTSPRSTTSRTGREADLEALTGLDYDAETANYPRPTTPWSSCSSSTGSSAPTTCCPAATTTPTRRATTRPPTFSNTGLSNNGLEENSFNSLVFTLNSVLSDNAFNEVIVQYAFEERPRDGQQHRDPRGRHLQLRGHLRPEQLPAQLPRREALPARRQLHLLHGRPHPEGRRQPRLGELRRRLLPLRRRLPTCAASGRGRQRLPRRRRALLLHPGVLGLQRRGQVRHQLLRLLRPGRLADASPTSP